MRSSGVFDDSRLKGEAAGASDYTQTRIYKTVPVVAAWDSIAEVASREGYQFRVPAPNPRNRKNTPTQDEERILRSMDDGKLQEYFHIDEGAQ
ncbi:MAG: DUF3365 domain-containing protein [Ignavibacteriota bacterium]